MGTKAKQAVQNHKNWYSCSSSVLCAFAEDAGMTEREAQRAASPYASGRAGICGALKSAEIVLEKKYPDQAKEKIRELEAKFIERNGSVMCRQLMGSCRKCVTDAAEILETMI